MPIIIKSGDNVLECIRLDEGEERTGRTESSTDFLDEIIKCLEKLKGSPKSEEKIREREEKIREREEKIKKRKENCANAKIDDSEDRDDSVALEFESVEIDLSDDSDDSPAWVLREDVDWYWERIDMLERENSRLSKGLARAKKKIIVLNETIDNLLNQIQEFGETDQEIPAEDDE